MNKKSISSICFLIAFLCYAQVLKAQDNPFYNYKGKLIIIGGGDIPDSLFTFFANYCGGKDQPIVYIPTATTDEQYIKEGGHLVKFTSRGFTNLSTIHTRDKVKADDPQNIELLRKATVYVNRIDYLICGDDGEENFLRRLKEDLNKLKTK
jgi:hypothetical protein